MLAMTRMTFYMHSTNGPCICASRETSKAPKATDSPPPNDVKYQSCSRRGRHTEYASNLPLRIRLTRLLLPVILTYFSSEDMEVAWHSRAARLHLSATALVIAQTDLPICEIISEWGMAETATLERDRLVTLDYVTYTTVTLLINQPTNPSTTSNSACVFWIIALLCTYW